MPQNPTVREPAPEERIARVVLGILKFSETMGNPKLLSLLELSATLSPYIQVELLEAAHQERTMCLADFYNLREKLVERERLAFQRSSELHAQIISRPEAKFITEVAGGGIELRPPGRGD
jgi:hypothetical protein